MTLKKGGVSAVETVTKSLKVTGIRNIMYGSENDLISENTNCASENSRHNSDNDWCAFDSFG